MQRSISHCAYQADLIAWVQKRLEGDLQEVKTICHHRVLGSVLVDNGGLFGSANALVKTIAVDEEVNRHQGNKDRLVEGDLQGGEGGRELVKYGKLNLRLLHLFQGDTHLHLQFTSQVADTIIGSIRIAATQLHT